MKWSTIVVFFPCVLGCAQAMPREPVSSSATQARNSSFAQESGWKEGKSAPTALRGAASNNPADLDPAKTDGDKYTVILENDRVRVLRYHDKPGDKTHLHHHNDMVMYPINAFRRRLTFRDGTTREREFKAGEAIWVPDQMHMGENIGPTDTEVLLVELKRR